MDATVPAVTVTEDLNSSKFDAIVVVSPNVSTIPFEALKSPLQSYVELDKSGEKGVFVCGCDLKAKKIIFSSTSPLENDYDDVRW